jgi:hypothetical protein
VDEGRVDDQLVELAVADEDAGQLRQVGLVAELSDESQCKNTTSFPCPQFIMVACNQVPEIRDKQRGCREDVGSGQVEDGGPYPSAKRQTSNVNFNVF